MGDSSRGYLTSSTLISTVKREALVPSNQQTFQDSDFLAMADQEIRIGMLPTVMQFHQEYLVYMDPPVPIVANQSAYTIPYRAIGGKIRDIFYLDNSNNFVKLTRIDPDNKPYFQQSSAVNSFYAYYVEGDNIVITPYITSGPTGSLVFSYYMLPNELVDESRVATIQSISNTNLSGTITGISVGNPTTITSLDPHGLTSGNIVNITGSNCTPSVDGFYTATVTGLNTFTVPVNVTVAATTQAAWTFETTIYTVDAIPTNLTAFTQNGQSITGFSTSALLDICQRRPGHHTIAYDLNALAVNTTNNTITFYTPDITTYGFSPNVISAPVTGDYISFSGEAIIPQIPAVLHDILSQRVVLRVLQALGDQAGYQVAKDKLDEMNKYMGNLIDNRTEGNLKKINNLSGVLRSSKAWNRIGFY